MSLNSEESSGWIEFLAWLEVHQQKLLLGGVGILLIGATLYVAKWKANQKEQVAGAALYELQIKQSQENEVEAEEFLALSETYAGTTAGGRALLLAARAHFVNGQFDPARKQFEQFRKLYDSSGFLDNALYGIAACYDAVGKLEEARTAYQTVVERFANTPIAAQAKLAIARIYEAQNNLEEALALYEELDRPGVSPSYTARASERRGKILKEHPELQPKPEVPVEAEPLDSAELSDDLKSDTAGEEASTSETAETEAPEEATTETPTTDDAVGDLESIEKEAVEKSEQEEKSPTESDEEAPTN